MWALPSFQLSAHIQKRLVKFILKRMIGQFIESNLQLDQLDISIGTTGTLVLRDLKLNIEGINQWLPHSFPFLLTSGSISFLQITVPWLELTSSSFIMQIDGVQISCIVRPPEPSPPVEKELPDLINSVYIANDFLSKQDNYTDPSFLNIPNKSDAAVDASSVLANTLPSDSTLFFDSPLLGVHYLAQIIDTILLNLKVCLTNWTMKVVSPSNSRASIQVNIPESSLSSTSEESPRETTSLPLPSKYLVLPSFYISASNQSTSDDSENGKLKSPCAAPFTPLLCTQHPSIFHFTRFDTGWKLVALHLKRLMSFVSPILFRLGNDFAPILANFKANSESTSTSPYASPRSISPSGTMLMIDPTQLHSQSPSKLAASMRQGNEPIQEPVRSRRNEEETGIERTVFYSMLEESSILANYTFSFQIHDWTWHLLPTQPTLAENDAWDIQGFLASSMTTLSMKKCIVDPDRGKFEVYQMDLKIPSISHPLVHIPSLSLDKHRAHLPTSHVSLSLDIVSKLSGMFLHYRNALISMLDPIETLKQMSTNSSCSSLSLTTPNTNFWPFQFQFVIDMSDIRINFSFHPSPTCQTSSLLELSISHILIPFHSNVPTLELYGFQMKLNQRLALSSSKDIPSIFRYSLNPPPPSLQTLFLPNTFQQSLGISKLFTLPYLHCELSSLQCYLCEDHLQLCRSMISSTRSSPHILPYSLYLQIRTFELNDTLVPAQIRAENAQFLGSTFGLLCYLAQSNLHVSSHSKPEKVLAWEQTLTPIRFMYDQTTKSRHAQIEQCKLFLHSNVIDYLKHIQQTFHGFLIRKDSSNASAASSRMSSFSPFFSDTTFTFGALDSFNVILKELDLYLYPPFMEEYKCIQCKLESGTLVLSMQPSLHLQFHRFQGLLLLDTFQWIQFQAVDIHLVQCLASVFPLRIFVDTPKVHLYFTPSVYQFSKKLAMSVSEFFLGASDSLPLEPVHLENGQPGAEVAEMLQSLLEPAELPATPPMTSPSKMSISLVDDFASFEEHLDQTIVLLDTDLVPAEGAERSMIQQFMPMEIVENYFADDHPDDCFADPVMFSPTHQENAMVRVRHAHVVTHLNRASNEPIAELHLEGHLETKRVESMHWATRLKLTQMCILDKCPSSTWHKLLTFEKHLYNVKLDWDWVHFEHRLVLQCQPMKLHLDQDTIQALLNFFSTTSSSSAAPSPLFFQRVEIFAMNIKLDYKPKKVDFDDLQAGQFLQLLNFFHLEGAELVLQHAVFTGVHGIEELIQLLLMHWLPHIKSTQLGSMVSGVGPLRSFVNLGSGMVDLILLPVAQYRKEGKVIKGLQRGAHSFVKTTAIETLNLGAKLSVGTHSLLRKADCYLENQPTPVQSAYAQQPKDIKEGIELAYKSISKNVSQVAKVLAMPIETMEKDKTGAMRQVLRAVPIAILKPMLGATEAMGKTLLGLRNTVDPSKKLEYQDKYKPV